MSSLPAWKWKPLKPYNGFSHIERVKVWQVQTYMIGKGWFPRASVCSISGKTDRVGWHSENYYDWAHSGFQINQGLHLALHSRFRNPAAWQNIVDRYAKTGEEWFAGLSMTEEDMAAEQRELHGAAIADIYGGAPLPPGEKLPDLGRL